MRLTLVLLTGAAVVLTAGTGAASAAVGPHTGSPTVAGNHLRIDGDHSRTVPVRATEPGDDRGASRRTEPGDDRGTAEPGDDRSGRHGGHAADDGGGHH